MKSPVEILGPMAIASALLFAASPALADVSIEATPVRDYQLPGGFQLQEAIMQGRSDGATFIANTTGMADQATCTVVFAEADGATSFEYTYEQGPTQCVGLHPHPTDGFFVRGSDPTAQEGEVTGFTTYIDEAGMEIWKIPDQQLVDAQNPPSGTGEFRGSYFAPHPVMAYSDELDKFLGFTIGKLTIGLDEKFLAQAHVANVESGTVTVSGQEFGQSGVGVVGGATTRGSDGHFLIYFFSRGDQGAFFYQYNGRQDISFFKPRGEDWDSRFVQRMIYRRDLLHLLWSPSDAPDAQTRVTAVTDEAAELWSMEMEPEYITSEGETVALGRAQTMWVTEDHTVILYLVDDIPWVRVLDVNGSSFGAVSLDGVVEQAPISIVPGENNVLKLLAYDDAMRRMHEYELTFTDEPDFDPDAGLPDAGDVGIPADVNVDEIVKDKVREELGCCATVARDERTDMELVWLALLAGVVFLRRRGRREAGG